MQEAGVFGAAERGRRREQPKAPGPILRLIGTGEGEIGIGQREHGHHQVLRVQDAAGAHEQVRPPRYDKASREFQFISFFEGGAAIGDSAKGNGESEYHQEAKHVRHQIHVLAARYAAANQRW